jgi:hypothetical protein
MSKQYIFTQVTQESIFEYYFGEKIDLAKKYKSPLREDITAGCSFFYGNSGDLLFFDSKEGNMDCFKFIMMKFNCDYYTSIIKIKMDFKLIKSANTKIINDEKEPYLKEISIKRKPFTEKELKFWQLPDMEITEELLTSYGIYSISDLWYNGIYKGYNLVDTFAYKQTLPYNYQIYRPFAEKNYKFRTNNGSYIYYKDRLDLNKEEVIINKSPKDSFYANVAGFNSIGVISEGVNISDETMQFLQSKFSKIYVCLDNDTAGQNYTEKLIKKHSFLIPRPPLFGKDYTDMIKEKGVKWVQNNW